MLNACTDWRVRRQPKNSVKRRAVRVQTGGDRAGRRQQIECKQLQLSGGARAEGSGVVVGAPTDPMEFRPSVRDVSPHIYYTRDEGSHLVCSKLVSNVAAGFF